MLRQIKITEYNKEDAFKESGISPIYFKSMKNATRAYRAQGCPQGDDIEKFAIKYLEKNRVFCCYIVLSSCRSNTRISPFEIIKNPTIGKRKYETYYRIIPTTNEIHHLQNGDMKFRKIEEENIPDIAFNQDGTPLDPFKSKRNAIKEMKKLITKNHRDYSIEVYKAPLDPYVANQSIVAFGKYTPSKAAKMGTFMFFFQSE